jgi:hypothetical protein
VAVKLPETEIVGGPDAFFTVSAQHWQERGSGTGHRGGVGCEGDRCTGPVSVGDGKRRGRETHAGRGGGSDTGWGWVTGMWAVGVGWLAWVWPEKKGNFSFLISFQNDIKHVLIQK